MLNVANHHHLCSNLDSVGGDNRLRLNHHRHIQSSSPQPASKETSSPLAIQKRVSKTEPNSKSSSSTSLANSAVNTHHHSSQPPGTPSRIPVYSFNSTPQGRQRVNSLSETLKHYHQLHHQLLHQQQLLQQQQFLLNQHQGTTTKHSLSAHQLSDLPEDVKLKHIVHCHCSHNLNSPSMPRSKTHDFTNGALRGSSVPSTSSTPGTSTPRGRKPSNASSANGRLSKASTVNNSTATATRTSNTGASNRSYEEYLPLCEMQKGLEKGEIVEGILRINPKNYNDAYISAPEEGLDIFIGGLYDRNRALNGDQVAVKLNDVDKWTLFPSALNAHWDEWKADIEKLIGEALLPASSFSTISQARLNQLLNSADLKKVAIASKALKNKNENENAADNSASDPTSTDLARTLALEFPHVPLVLYNLDLATLHSQLPAYSCQFIQKSGRVVALCQANHSRVVGGTICLQQGNKAKLLSSDTRVPHVMLPFTSLPRDFVRSYEQLKENLFLVEITEWKESSLFPRGRILQTLGTVGDLDSELEVLLRSNDIDTADFPAEALAEYDLFSAESWKIPPEELTYRRDFRQQCVFTIDPQSARDLDDAISLVKLSSSGAATPKETVYEVGVHIADVSYFIRERTLLDGIAKERATSVYLPSRVIPMLPHLFCQQLCSLNPGEDKLTFSVVFKMTGDGVLLPGEAGRPWIGRTVINSCAKLSYEHAQKMIERPLEDLIQSGEEEFPTIHGHWPLSLLAGQVKTLQGISSAIRKRRFETGSLRLDKTKIGFLLDEATGLPVSFAKYDIKESHRLIEELMLLANRAVAERLYEVFARSGRAFLRGHPPPNANSLNLFAAFCASTGFTDFDTSSSGAIYKSLDKLQQQQSSKGGNVDATVNFRLFSLSLIKSMKLAVYQTVSDRDKPAAYHHYALNFPKYTHFTSPIRRYADVIVHRLLCDSLGYADGGGSSMCSADSTDLRRIAANCNARKQAAFIVSEKANELYLKKYIASIESLTTPAVVCAVYDHSFDVLVLQFDIVTRIYLDRLPLERFELLKDDRADARLLLQWTPLKAEEVGGAAEQQQQPLLPSEALRQTITSLQQLDVKLSVDKKFNFHVLIAHPNGDFVFSPKGQQHQGQQQSKSRNSASESSSTTGEEVLMVVGETAAALSE